MGNHRRIGKCKLCLKYGVSVNRTSILPAWARKEKTVHLLCNPCMIPFRECETHVHNLLSHREIDSKRLDFEKLAFYIAGVAWKASCSNREGFFLDEYEESFRQYLLGGLPPREASVKIDLDSGRRVELTHTSDSFILHLKGLKFEINLHQQHLGKGLWHYLTETEPHHRCLWWGQH